MNRHLVLVVVVLLATTAAWAEDLYTPSFRGAPEASYQNWTFEHYTEGFFNDVFPDELDNSFGGADINFPYADWEYGWDYWLDYSNGRQGVWYLDYYDVMEISISNDDDPWQRKEIYLQITWWGGGLKPQPEVYYPQTGWTMTEEDEQTLSDGWMYTRWYIEITPSPTWEQIDVWAPSTAGNGVYFDQVVVDTYCVPEPASVGLLGLVALWIARRR